MTIKVRYIDDAAIVDVKGKININSSKIIEAVGNILDRGVRKIIINMQAVDFLDYNGLSVLTIAYKSALNNKAALKLCGISQHIVELLRVVRLDEVFEIYDNVEDTLAALKRNSKMSREDILEQPVRRKFMRLDIDMPVSYRYIKGTSYKGDMRLEVGRIANISAAGIFIRTINTLPLGSEIEIEVKLEKSQEPKRLKGIVMWLADKGLQPDFFPGMGAYFVGLSQRKQEEVIGFVEKHTIHRKG